MERYLPPPEIVAGFIRGLWHAALLGAVAYFGVEEAASTDAALKAFFAAFFGTLVLRTGEGGYDALRNRKLTLTPIQQDAVDRIARGESFTYDPTPPPPEDY